MTTLLRGGRVVDPGSGTDGVSDVLVRDGQIAAVGPALDAPSGATVLDTSGLIVGPGFIDLHSHVHTIAGQRLQAMDGVTTVLDLESGLMPVREGLARAAREGRPLNFGYSASWAQARALAHLGLTPSSDLAGADGLLGDPEWQRTSSSAERRVWRGALEEEITAGALGIGVLLGYAPRSDPAEYLDIARLAASAGVPTFTHVRELIEADPTTPIDGSEELIRAAGETGASMHHCHVNSTSLRHVDRVLALFDRARSEGSRVTLEAYPYGAGSTSIGAYFFAPEKLPGLGITPRSLVMVESGERIADVARLRELRAADPGALCVAHMLDEDDPADHATLLRSLAYPDSIVASDAMPVVWPDREPAKRFDTREWPLPPGGRTHPRTAGTFAKSIRLMLRETAAWTWLEAFRRCSLLPARVLADTAPGMRAKGHLGIGADADLVVLDPGVFRDTASFEDPTRPSVGVRHLLVNGRPVVRDGALLVDAYPGRPVRGEP